MKKSLLLAALLLSSAAQAETYVCSGVLAEGNTVFLSFVRQESDFSMTVTVPETETSTAEAWDAGQFKTLVETDAMLTLARISPDGERVTVFMINKMTNQFVSTATLFEKPTPRLNGSCLKV